MAKTFFVTASPLTHVSHRGVPALQLKHKTLHIVIMCFSHTQPHTYYTNTISRFKFFTCFVRAYRLQANIL